MVYFELFMTNCWHVISEVGYDNLALAVDYEFPKAQQLDDKKTKGKGGGGGGGKKQQQEKAAKVTVPEPLVYQMPAPIQGRIKNAGRKVHIYTMINI